MKKHDAVIVIAVFLIFAASLFAFSFNSGSRIVVKQNNKTVYSGSLFTDKTVKLKNNVLVIKNGVAYMKDANCKNHICVHTGKISKKGESIICLPNKVIAQIE